eukprot:TRINITY_DN320_c0_g1_i1.p1 TRINITY_DN320_c0_g1~~TRINITY_DN320_c0_g1_i1.p1  ORF type:complete len:400 (-),score=90.79 TRINITY_DN320_c0_g1_i1:213-1412(-)
MKAPVHNFSNVAIGLPCKVRGSEAEDEWQEVDWATWSTGDLSVDGESFLLVFKPEGSSAGSVKAKPLGNLIRASAVAHDEGRTVVVSTSDALHKLYRLTFDSAASATAFNSLAKAAEERSAATASDAVGGPSNGESDARLEADIRERLSGRLPLVFGGAELYGPDPNGEAGNEVLLGRGAFALLDPQASEASGKLGTYQLLFYSEDEGARQAKKSFDIAHKMALKEQAPEDEDGPAAAFEFSSASGVFTVTFDSANVAAAFARDFRVRQRLMEMAVKTVKGMRTSAGLRDELEEAKRNSLAARLKRYLGLFVFLFLIGCAVRLFTLYSEDKSRPVPEHLQTLSHEIMSLGRLSRGAATKATTKACKLAVGAVPSEDVRVCASLPSASQAKDCIDNLLSR